jgi:ankyrin repeat protein
MDTDERSWLLRLETAILARDEDGVTKLLKEPSSKEDILKSRGPDRQFPLYWSVQSDSLAILCSVLRAGAEVGQRTADSWTALHCAAYNNRLDMVKKLLNSPNADVNETTLLLETPLHLAARQGHVAMVRLLLSSGLCSLRSERVTTP